MEAKDSFEHVNHIRYKIAHMYKEHIVALRLRAAAMSDIFDREIGYLISYFTNSKKKKGAPAKKFRRIMGRLSSIQPEIKHRVL